MKSRTLLVGVILVLFLAPRGAWGQHYGRELLHKAISLYSHSYDPETCQLARDTFEQAVDAGEILAQMWVARFHFNGRCGFEQNEEEARQLARFAIDEVRRLADNRDPEAMFLMGALCQEGLGTERDLDRSNSWYRKAARAGHAGAMFNLGLNYYGGAGVEQDVAKAADWWTQAARAGDADAMYNLGQLHYEGVGLPHDYGAMIECWEAAAALGHRQAIYSLAGLYLTGTGVAQDPEHALMWYRRAAGAGHADAAYRSARLVEAGVDGDPDWAECAQWYESAAVQGHQDAGARLGRLYYYGFGVEHDLDQAFVWLQKATQQGSLEGLALLGRLYLDGRAVERDPVRAHDLFAQGVETGDPEAMAGLAETWENGLGVEPDPVRAASWYRLAAEEGHADAAYRLGELYRAGQGVPRDPAAAGQWYRQAAQTGHAPAAWALGTHYWNKRQGTPANRAEALRWWRVAAEAGHSEAQEKLALYEQGRLDDAGVGVPTSLAARRPQPLARDGLDYRRLPPVSRRLERVLDVLGREINAWKQVEPGGAHDPFAELDLRLADERRFSALWEESAQALDDGRFDDAVAAMEEAIRAGLDVEAARARLEAIDTARAEHHAHAVAVAPFAGSYEGGEEQARALYTQVVEQLDRMNGLRVVGWDRVEAETLRLRDEAGLGEAQAQEQAQRELDLLGIFEGRLERVEDQPYLTVHFIQTGGGARGVLSEPLPNGAASRLVERMFTLLP